MRPLNPNQFRREPFSPKDLPGLSAWYDVSAVVNNGNYMARSEEFNSTWSLVGLNAFGAADTGAAGAGSFANTQRTLDPLGSNTAEFIQENAAVTEHNVLQSRIMPATTLIATCCLKAAGRNFASLQLVENGGAFTRVSAYFNLVTGAATVPVVTGAWVGVSASTIDRGNGWFECRLVAINPVERNTDFRIYASSNGSVVSYAGDNTSGVYIWGASLRLAAWEDRYISTGQNPIFPNAQADALNAVVNLRDLSRDSVDGRGNLLRQSEDFQTTWSRARINAFGAVDTGALGAGSFANTARTLDPLGGNFADFIQEDATAATTFNINQTNTVDAGTYDYSCWVKAAGRSWVFLRVAAGADIFGAYFDVGNGVPGVLQSIGSAVALSSSMVDYSNGWYLCTVRGTLPLTASTGFFIFIAEADNDNIYSGNNTSGLFIYGSSFRKAAWPAEYVRTGSVNQMPFREGSFRDLYQGTGSAQPLLVANSLAGKPTVQFNGTTQFFRSPAFPLTPPATVYIVYKPESWTANDYVYDGASSNGMALQQVGAPDGNIIFSGTQLGTLNIPVGSWSIVSAVFNGANSKLGNLFIGEVSGNVGASLPNGFTLAAVGNGSVGWSNISVAEVVIYSAEHDAATRLKVQQYLAGKWGLRL